MYSLACVTFWVCLCVYCMCVWVVLCCVCVSDQTKRAPKTTTPKTFAPLGRRSLPKIRGGLAWLAETLIMFVVLPLLPLLLLCFRQLTVCWHIMRTQQQPRRLNRRRAVGGSGGNCNCRPRLWFLFALATSCRD